jgi:glycosyltransferase involved in cell wall biosynthesis
VRTVHAVLPNDIDDPASPSGGNVYDRRVLDGLTALGWTVVEHPVAGTWPAPSPAALAGLAELLAGLPDRSVVLVDGLVGSAAADVLVPVAGRLRLVALVHLPLGSPAEAAVLAAVAAVVVTSPWTRRLLPGRDVVVATPGVDPAPLAPGSAAGNRLLCVAAVSPHKGHDLLTAALRSLPEPFTCTYAGSLTRDPDFVRGLPVDDRFRLTGPLTGAALDAAYAEADLVVLASRGETYGMVVTEALARGLPVVATDVGGVPVALGTAPDGTVPGLLVPPAGLAGALRRWLTEPALRDRLRAAARGRRTTLTGWDETAATVARVLEGV